MTAFLERVTRFVTVADTGSLTKAALVLSVDQPWLSRQMLQLEAALGFALFQRTPHGLRLTDDGANFLVSARLLVHAAGEVRASAQRLQRGHGHLKLGVIAFSFWVPVRTRLIAAFREKYPGIELELVTDSIPAMLKRLEVSNLDVLLLGHAPADSARYDYLEIHRSKPGILVPMESPLATKPELKMADLNGELLAVAPTYQSSALYLDFLAIGMTSYKVVEGRSAMSYYAHRERLFVLTWDDKGPEIPVPSQHVLREIADGPLAISYGLVRLRGDDRPIVQNIWALGRRCATFTPSNP